jgi:hypothetical protein
MMGLFAAVHESASGTQQNRADATACPQLEKADIRGFGRGSGFDPMRRSGVTTSRIAASP